MTKSNPGILAVFLILGAVALGLWEQMHPLVLPGCTPFVALSFLAAVYLPHKWSWTVGAAGALLLQLAFRQWSAQSEGHALSFAVIFLLGFYLIMGVCGLQASARPSLLTLFGGPLVGSLVFYLITNTISWATLQGSDGFSYAHTLAGWVQANTTGEPGYPPVWTFLRNGLGGDLVFTILLIMILDPNREVFAQRGNKSVVGA